jgi:hypothetical protein
MDNVLSLEDYIAAFPDVGRALAEGLEELLEELDEHHPTTRNVFATFIMTQAAQLQAQQAIAVGIRDLINQKES